MQLRLKKEEIEKVREVLQVINRRRIDENLDALTHSQLLHLAISKGLEAVYDVRHKAK